MKNWEDIGELVDKVKRYSRFTVDGTNDLADIVGHLPWESGPAKAFRFVVGTGNPEGIEHYDFMFSFLADAIGGKRMMRAIQEIAKEEQAEEQAKKLAELEKRMAVREKRLEEAKQEAYENGFEDARQEIRKALGL